MNQILDFLNNGSVAAFLGAFAAFMLVAFTDSRRESKKVRHIKSEVEMNLDIARGRLETVRKKRERLNTHNQMTPFVSIKFNTNLIRQMCSEVLNRLSFDQRRAIEAVCYSMEGIDEDIGLMNEELKLFEAGQADPVLIRASILSGMNAAIINIKRLMEQCENYINADYNTILTKKYSKEDYEEPLQNKAPS
jgi:hypothetical protein